jgi:hypothetical protein
MEKFCRRDVYKGDVLYLVPEETFLLLIFYFKADFPQASNIFHNAYSGGSAPEYYFSLCEISSASIQETIFLCRYMNHRDIVKPRETFSMLTSIQLWWTRMAR